MSTDGAYQLSELEISIYDIQGGGQDINGVGGPIFVAWNLVAVKNSIPVTRPSSTEFLLPPGDYLITVTLNWTHPGGAVNHGMQYRARLNGVDDNIRNSYSTGPSSIAGSNGDSWTFPILVPAGPGVVLSIGSRNQYNVGAVSAILGRITITRIAQ